MSHPSKLPGKRKKDSWIMMIVLQKLIYDTIGLLDYLSVYMFFVSWGI